MAHGDTNLTNLVLSGDLTVGDDASVAGNLGVTGTLTAASLNAVSIVKITETVAYDDFTDGGSTSGTFELSTDIPIGAYVICCNVTAVTGFAGDTTAVLTVGDGTDVDRYNTGTVNVFATAANGVAAGIPSGTRYHATAATPTLTVTSGSDFGAVNAGSVTVEIIYIS